MIKFIKCTAEQYAAAKTGGTINADYFYLTTDTNEFYLGERHLTDQDLSTYLTSVTAKDNSIQISNNSEIEVKISTKANNGLTLVTESGREGLYVNAVSPGGGDDYTVSITETSGQAGDAYSKRYRVQQLTSGLDANIDIPKDMVVESGSVINIVFDDTDNTLHEGTISGADVTSKIKGQGETATAADAGKYIKLIIANSSSDTLYIAAKSLVDIYTAKANADKIQLAIDANNEISANIVTGSIAKTDLTQAVQDSLAAADNALNASDITTGATNGTIAVKGNDIAVYGLGTAAYANTTDFDAAGSAAAVLGSATDTASANTVYGAKKYAESLSGIEWETLS